MLVLSSGVLAVGAVLTGLAVWNLKPSPAPARPCHAHGNQSAAGPTISGFGKWPCCGPLSRRHTSRVCRHAKAAPSRFISGQWIAWRQAHPRHRRSYRRLFSRPMANGWGFSQAGRLKKVSVNGGAAVDSRRMLLPTGPEASWGSQGMIAIPPACSFSSPASPGCGRRRRSR